MTAAHAPAQLTYYIFEGILIGSAGGKHFHISALSGGAGGSTKLQPAASVNNPYSTALKTAKSPHKHGGPLPIGKYRIEPPGRHPHLGLSAQLTQVSGSTYGRGGFFIHGRGPHGSDGCIVPMHNSEFQGLMTALSNSRGGTLYVLETIGRERFA